MWSKLQAIFHALNTRGAVFPHQLAFTLLIPLRNWALSPRQLVNRLSLAPDMQILEVGCGPGYFSPALAQAVPQGRLVLADIQPEMLAYAQKRLRRRGIRHVEYYLCDGRGFAFADQCFDRIVLVTVLGEIADPISYLNEFHRLLKPDGQVSVSEAAGDADRIRRDALCALMRQHGFEPVAQFGSEGRYTVNFRLAGQSSPKAT